MTRAKWLSVALAVAAAAALTTGTAGFSSVQADRGVSVSVVSDDRALVDVDACHVARTPNQGAQTPVRVRVRNQLPSALTVASVNGESVGETVPPGGVVTFTEPLSTPVTAVTVAATSDGGTSVTLTRDVAAKADCPFDVGDGDDGDDGGDGGDENSTVDDGETTTEPANTTTATGTDTRVVSAGRPQARS